MRKNLSIGMNGRRGRSVTPAVAMAHTNADVTALHCTIKRQYQILNVREMRSTLKHAHHNRALLSGLSGAIALLRVRKIHQVSFGENVGGSVLV